MSVIAFPLGFKIVDNTGAANTGKPIDERLVFASSTARTDYISNFFYEGLLSYTIGVPYHGSGVTSDAGFYYRNSANSWVGLNADTLDDKHANGTMDSGSTSESDASTGTNIVDHINYIYTLTSALSTSRAWKAPVTNFADLATTYPTPITGWTSLVTSENSIYTYNGSIWVKTGGNIPALSPTVSGIVSNTWYTTLNDLITTPTNYVNKNVFGNVAVQNNGSSVVNSPTVASSTTDTFTLNLTGNLTGSVSGKTITINGSGGSGGIVTINDNFAKWDTTGQYYRFYTDKTEAGSSISGGKFFNGTDSPGDTIRLNYDGYLYATKLFTGGVEVQKILPDQTGNNGKYLGTDGTNMSWSEIPAIAGLQTPITQVLHVTNSTTDSLTIGSPFTVFMIVVVTVNGIEYYQDIDFTVTSNTLNFIGNLPYDSTAGDTIVRINFIQYPTVTIAETLDILTDASLVLFDPTGTSMTSTDTQSAIIELFNSAGLILGETSVTAYRGDRGKIAYDHTLITSGNPHNVTKTDVGLGNVLDTIQEPALGNPSSNGYVLSSTTSGTRSWIANNTVTGTDGNIVIIQNNIPVDSGLSYALILAGL
jgi:hypothetical protein